MDSWREQLISGNCLFREKTITNENTSMFLSCFVNVDWNGHGNFPVLKMEHHLRIIETNRPRPLPNPLRRPVLVWMRRLCEAMVVYKTFCPRFWWKVTHICVSDRVGDRKVSLQQVGHAVRAAEAGGDERRAPPPGQTVLRGVHWFL